MQETHNFDRFNNMLSWFTSIYNLDISKLAEFDMHLF